jgi:hypothetical protein
MFLLLACILGIFLGLYFSVTVLLPASLIGSAIFILINLSAGLSFYANFGYLLLLLVSGQAGYMLGLTGRDTYGHLLARFRPVPSNRI